MEKILGCSKNHSKEIDLYEKTYGEKVERIETMMSQAKLAYEETIEIVDGESIDDQKRADEL